MAEDLEEEKEIPVRGCGPEGPRTDEQEVSTYSGAPCRHDTQQHHNTRRRQESTLRDVVQKRGRAVSVKRKKKHEKAEKEGKQHTTLQQIHDTS